MEKIGIDGRVIPTNGQFKSFDNGGKGSGNFGHAGRPGKVGGSAPEGAKFSEGDEVSFYQYGGTSKGKIIRKLSEQEKQDRAALNNPNAGDYYEIEAGSGDFASKFVVWEARIKKLDEKEKKLDEIRDKNRQKRESEMAKAKAEREAHVKQIDKIIGNEKITQGKTKAEDDVNYKKFERDISKIKTILAKEKSRENFGQEEVRKLRDKYSDYMSGNWSVTGRFQERIRQFEDWADNYANNSLENIITNAIVEVFNGGKGSGNFGHAGRPGEVGGSAPSGSSSSIDQDDMDLYMDYLESRALTKKVFKDLGYDDPAKLTEKDWKKLYKEVDKRAEKELKEEIKVKSKEYDQLFDKLWDASRDTNNENVSAMKKLLRQFDDTSKIWNLEPEDQPAEYDRRIKEIKKILAESKKSKSEGPSLRGKSLYEKVHMIEPGDEVHIKPSSKVPNFPKKIKVDYVEDGTIHYGSSEISDGYTYPAWAIDDIKKIIRKK